MKKYFANLLKHFASQTKFPSAWTDVRADPANVKQGKELKIENFVHDTRKLLTARHWEDEHLVPVCVVEGGVQCQ